MKALQLSIAVFCIYLAGTSGAAAKTIRATDLSPSTWEEINSGKFGETIVEFRKGDELPVTLSSKGDLLETVHVGASYVAVKRNFWVKLGPNDDILMSLDGVSFKKLQDTISGTLTAGATSPQNGEPVNAINFAVESKLK